MNAVEKRVQTRIKQEGKALRGEQAALTKRRKAAQSEADKIVHGIDAAMQALRDGHVLSAQQEKVMAKAGTLTRLSRTIAGLNAELAVVAEKLARLDTPEELQRRIAAAAELGVGDEPMSGPAAAEAVLIHKGKAMHVEDITREMLESGTVRLTGKTPTQTVSAYLAKKAAKGDTFVRVAPGVFDLKDRSDGATDGAKNKAAVTA